MDNVRFGSKADIEAPPPDVRFTPESGHCRARSPCPLLAGALPLTPGAAFTSWRLPDASDTKRSRAGGAEILHRCDNGGAGERAPLQRSQHTQFVYARPEPIHTASL